jgi:hypothetical protein
VDVVRPSRRMATQHRDVDKQRLQAEYHQASRGRATTTGEMLSQLKQEIVEYKPRRRRSGGQALQEESRPDNGGGDEEAVFAREDAHPNKGVAATTEESESPTRLVKLLFPIGVLVLDNDKPPKPRAGPEKVSEY